MSDKVRVHVIITGRVQGVAYRYSTQDAAYRFNVFGWVRNKKDGRVEAVFEGEKADVDSMLAWCETGPRMAEVKNVAVTWEEYSGEFSSFDITF